MKRLLVIWFSRTGGSRQMAEAAAGAARAEESVDVVFVAAADATAGQVLEADALLFAAPENLAALAGEMKAFFDRTYYDLLHRINGKPYAALICAGSDGSGARRQLERIATGLRLRRVAETLIVGTQAQSAQAILATKRIPEDALALCAEVGAALAAGLAAGIF